MLKRINKQKKKEKSSIFIKESYFLTESDNNPVFEKDIKTFKIEKDNQKRYVIYLMEDNKKIRKKTIKPKKNEKREDIIRRIQQDKIKINISQKKNISKRSNLYQRNYSGKPMKKVNYKTTSHLICVVLCHDTKRDIQDHFIGYSSTSSIIRKSNIDKLEQDCKEMAAAKFIDRYGTPKNSSDLKTLIVERRTNTYKTKLV
jgi:hypothetical protein